MAFDYIFKRTLYDMLSSCDAQAETSLHDQLAKRGVTQIVLTGIATSVGVESTARSAHDYGYNVTLVADAMTDRDADAHRHSVEKVFPEARRSGDDRRCAAAIEKRTPVSTRRDHVCDCARRARENAQVVRRAAKQPAQRVGIADQPVSA